MRCGKQIARLVVTSRVTGPSEVLQKDVHEMKSTITSTTDRSHTTKRPEVMDGAVEAKLRHRKEKTQNP